MIEPLEWNAIKLALEMESTARRQLANEVRHLAIYVEQLHRAELGDDGMLRAIIDSLEILASRGGAS